MKTLKFAKGYYLVIDSYEGDGDYSKEDTIGPISDKETAIVLKDFALLVNQDQSSDKVTEKLVEFVLSNKRVFEGYTNWKLEEDEVEDFMHEVLYDMGLSAHEYPYRECNSVIIEYYDTDVYCERV